MKFSICFSEKATDAPAAGPSSAPQLGTSSAPELGQSSVPQPQPFRFWEYKSSEILPIQDYFRRLELTFVQHGIPQALYGKYTRAVMGAELNEALKTIVQPRNPENLSFEDIRKHLQAHFDGREKRCSNRDFPQMKQKKGESSQAFLNRIAVAVEKHGYGNTFSAFAEIKKQFLAGLLDPKTRDKISAWGFITFDNLCDVIHLVELGF